MKFITFNSFGYMKNKVSDLPLIILTYFDMLIYSSMLVTGVQLF